MDVIPEVAAIIGPQPAVPVLAPTEAKTRFERAVVSFVQVFTSKFCAILFLDGNPFYYYSINYFSILIF